jgi:hypothetical protein
MAKGYVDSDGHVMENEGELNKFIEAPFNNRYITYRQLLPTLDSFHTPTGLPRRPGTFDPSVVRKDGSNFLKGPARTTPSCILRRD